MTHTADTDEYRFIADLYDHVTPYKNRDDVQFFVDAAKNAGGPVLEIGCGTGRVLIPTARAGVGITGLDLSAHMLAECRAHLDAEPADVQSHADLVQADMRAFDLGRTFALATFPFRPFQHLTTVDDQLACLACARRHLNPGGTLILDLFNPSLEALANRRVGEEHDDTAEFTVPDGRRVTRRAKIVAHDRVNQLNHIELIYYVTHPDGRSERLVQAFQMRYLFRFEVEHLLARSGFEVAGLFAGYDKRALGSTYPGELIFVARRI